MSIFLILVFIVELHRVEMIDLNCLLPYWNYDIDTVFEIPRKKVSFNIASEASYVYILSGQKFIKNCQKWSNLASF